MPCSQPHFFTLASSSWGPGTAPPRRDEQPRPTLTQPRSPALPQGADGPCWDEHRPYKALLTLQLRKHLPSPDGQWVRLRAEGPSRDSRPPCALLPIVGSLSVPPPTCPLFLCPSPPPPLPPSFQMEKPAPLCFLRCRKLPREKVAPGSPSPPLNGFQHAGSQAACLAGLGDQSHAGASGVRTGGRTGE